MQQLCSINLGIVATVLLLTGRIHGLGYVERRACGKAAATYKYSDANLTKVRQVLCRSKAFTGTVALCIGEHTQDTKRWWQIFDAAYCAKHQLPLPAFAVSYENATQFITDAPSNISVKTKLPFQVPEAAYEVQRKHLDASGSNLYWSTTLGWLMVICAASIIFLIALTQRLASLTSLQRRPKIKMAAGIIKKHLVLPVLIGSTEKRRRQAFGITIAMPWRLQSVVAVVFVAINIVLMFAFVNVYDDEARHKTRFDQWSKHTADRAAILALGQLPFLVIFAGRNHIFMWATGWSFQTFNRFHKLIAYIFTAHIIVHAGLYTYLKARKEPLQEFWAKGYVRWGTAGLTAFILLTTGSIAVVQKHWYDAWLSAHIVLAATALTGAWKHVSLSHHGKGKHVWMPWIYATVALWIFDRVLRIIRVAVFNWTVSANKSAYATAVLLNEDVVKMCIPVSRRWQFFPGQYIFLYLPGYSYQQNHPFAVVDVKTNTNVSMVTIVFTKQKGMTKRVHEACLVHSSATGSPLRVRALVEGPYGSQPRLEQFDSVIMAAGGIGITAIVPVLMHLVALPIQRPSRSVSLHWVIRNGNQAAWFVDEFSRALRAQGERKNLIAKIVVHVTGGPGSCGSSIVNEKKISTVSQEPVDLPMGIEVRQGRPALTSLISTELSETMDNSSVAVINCGPATFGDACRASVIANLGTSSRRISHIEETFGW